MNYLLNDFQLMVEFYNKNKYFKVIKGVMFKVGIQTIHALGKIII